MIKGIHYRSPRVYQLITKFLLGKNSGLRFDIASRYLSGSKTVLDVCAGTGLLKKYLPRDCSYTALDASPEFIRFLKKKNIDGRLCLLEQMEPSRFGPKRFDASVMIVSLCQFRPYDIDGLIERLKKMAKKCVIVEDVKKRPLKSINAWMNYFCARDYTRPCAVFMREEFEKLMSSHGFSVSCEGNRYSCAVYESAE